ncbi:epoxyqueuosine reductase [Fusibacter ferrireducens]|uniref:Epoxyqueuosine reductase n=1 Tax=Fusibacter ferrireducens TaxID=2785058 RepID=A0ABR9ZPT8_9FIRM|nr:epoxyqueuosine reductase [Fusibacter ferrireducens]MBF4691996.1 epoxyqueuosine reductase [Fusibacter ferrireducens]
MNLENDFKKYILELGADQVGFADLSEIPGEHRQHLNYGISIAKAIDPEIVRYIASGPNQNYYKEYKRLNAELDQIALQVSEKIKAMGYEAIAKTTTTVASNESLRTDLPHKTVATRAGMGWIGKCALLITKDYGSAVRLTSVLTNLKLSTATPINESKCGNCTLCTDVCEGKAVKGINWHLGMEREAYYDAKACRKEARKKCDLENIESTICGQCINICPYTRRYIKI